MLALSIDATVAVFQSTPVAVVDAKVAVLQSTPVAVMQPLQSRLQSIPVAVVDCNSCSVAVNTIVQ